VVRATCTNVYSAVGCVHDRHRAAPPHLPRTALADTVPERVTAGFPAPADPGRAGPMRAYTRDVAPFLGIPTPDRRAPSRTVLAGTPRPDEADCTAIALRCWALPERAYHYFAVDYPRRHAGRRSSGFLPVTRHLVTTVPWWDTVDPLAVHVVGRLVAADRGLTADMDDWITDGLREYAKTDPEAVRAFLARERGRFAPLTVREALKHIGG
jgi:3-methyladenine DNA glycosylase AlkD